MRVRVREKEESEREEIEKGTLFTYTYISVPQLLYMCNNTVIHDPVYHRNPP